MTCLYSARFRNQLEITLSSAAAQLRLLESLQYGLRQGSRVARIDQQAVLTWSDPLAQRLDIAGHRETTAGHRFQQRVGRAIMFAGRDTHLAGLEQGGHLGLSLPGQQLYLPRNSQLAYPALRLGLARHGGAEKAHLRIYRQHTRDSLEEGIVAHISPQAARVDHLQWTVCRLLKLAQRVEHIQAQASIAGHNQTRPFSGEAVFRSQAQVAPAVGVQRLRRLQRLACQAIHQRSRNRMQGEIVAPYRNQQRHGRSRQGGNHAFVGDAHGMHQLRLQPAGQLLQLAGRAFQGQWSKPLAHRCTQAYRAECGQISAMGTGRRCGSGCRLGRRWRSLF